MPVVKQTKRPTKKMPTTIDPLLEPGTKPIKRALPSFNFQI